MKWFMHDSNANQDAKLKKLKMQYGLEGYGLYWYCLELICSDISAEKYTFELEHDAEIIAHDTGLSVEKVSVIMQAMVELGLFESDGGYITCLKLAKRLAQSSTSNPQMRQIIKAVQENHDAVMTPSRQNHDFIRPDKIRLDKTRLDKSKDTVSALPQAEDAPAAAKRVNYQEIVDLYHEILPNHPKVKVLTEARKRHIRKLALKNLPDLEHWRKFFNAITRSDFLSGRVEPRDGRRPFIADLDFLIKPDKYVKILEGRYHE